MSAVAEASAADGEVAPVWTMRGRLARLWRRLCGEQGDWPSYWLTRFLFLRLLAVVYLVAFLVILFQWAPLLGPHGLTPAASYLTDGLTAYASRWDAFWHEPTLFWWVAPTPGVVTALTWLGLVLSGLAVLGWSNALSWLVLWATYFSFVSVGQIWYAFGWESQLLETGFLAVFLCPALDPRPFPDKAPPLAVIWLLRWLIMRIMLGAGLIKMRGSACWRDLTCLDTHYETQPIPNPLSAFWHHLPHWAHAAGVLFNHATELVAPLLVLGPRRLRLLAGVMMVLFQVMLILSGNLSFLNYLTIAPALACFDDRFLRRLLPGFVVRRADRAAARARGSSLRGGVSLALVAVVAVLSVPTMANLLSSEQRMNMSFDPLRHVSTYGAFGSVGEVRHELILEGTDAEVPDASAEWREYELPCKPGDVRRQPCWLSPYHLRLDWLMWFAAMSRPGRDPWLIHLVYELLHGDPEPLALLANNPFPDAPPRYLRIVRYRYAFAGPEEPDRVWVRSDPHLWLPPLSADNAPMREYLIGVGLLAPGTAGEGSGLGDER